ncbi:MAG TPA: NAD(P)H-binding protein [Gemmatimonadaceae bacterium]|nr:NAD(P)H-binding protein [Gemmatimonadaceae bacterium]
MPPLAFITGATGYTGRHVVRACMERGVSAVAHVRADSPRLAEWRERFEGMGATVDATPWEERAMTATLARLAPTHVFALLGTTRSRGRRAAREGGGAESYETVDYALTALLLRAAVACGSHPRFVYLSSLGASESTRNAYLRVRGRLEREVAASGLPYLIVRPSFITGPDREEHRPLERLAAAAADTALALVASLGARRLRDRYHSLTGAQLAEGMVRMAMEREGSGVVTGEELRGAAPTSNRGS